MESPNGDYVYGGRMEPKYIGLIIATLVLLVITIIVGVIFLVTFKKNDSLHVPYWAVAMISGLALCFGNAILWHYFKRKDCELGRVSRLT
jgi:ABC-type polysaccharide/polyol phosphate export permease